MQEEILLKEYKNAYFNGALNVLNIINQKLDSKENNVKEMKKCCKELLDSINFQKDSLNRTASNESKIIV